MTPEVFLTATQVARMLGTTPSIVRTAVENNQLASLREPRDGTKRQNHHISNLDAAAWWAKRQALEQEAAQQRARVAVRRAQRTTAKAAPRPDPLLADILAELREQTRHLAALVEILK